MDELISKTALLAHLRKERDEYLRVHFKQDPATGCWESNTPQEEYLGDLEERIDFIEQFPPVEAARIEQLEAALRHIEAQCTEAISYGHTNINGVLTTIARAALAPETKE
jgi:hypothetical protein